MSASNESGRLVPGLTVWLTGCIFLLSGVAGLIYEVVWFRMLATTFGATGPALAATTASFMAGLGLGSRLAGGRADRMQRPIQVYAPQHTHPHPSFSPDGKLVLYTSDASGYAQLYEVTVEE